MKKIILSFILILILIVCIFNIYPHKKTKILNNDFKIKKSNSNISMMIESSPNSGEYIESTQTNFPTGGYIFNAEKSYCENGSKINWLDESQKIWVETTKGDKCYAYFDIRTTVEDLSGHNNTGILYNIGKWDNEGITFDEYYAYYIAK